MEEELIEMIKIYEKINEPERKFNVVATMFEYMVRDIYPERRSLVLETTFNMLRERLNLNKKLFDNIDEEYFFAQDFYENKGLKGYQANVINKALEKIIPQLIAEEARGDQNKYNNRVKEFLMKITE